MCDIDAGVDHRDPHVIAFCHRMRCDQMQLADGVLPRIVPCRLGLLEREAIVARHRADAAGGKQLPRHRLDRATVGNAPAEHGRADQRKILRLHPRQAMPVGERDRLGLGHRAVDLDDDLARDRVRRIEQRRRHGALRRSLLRGLLRLCRLVAALALRDRAP
jgi:hypothetical protein